MKLPLIAVTTAALLAGFSTTAAARDIAAGTTEIGGATSFAAGSVRASSDGSTEKTTVSAFNLSSRQYFQDDVAFGLSFTRIDTDIESSGSHVGVTQNKLAAGLAFNKSINDNVSLNFGPSFLVVGERRSVDFANADAQGRGIRLHLELQSFVNEHVAFNFGGYLDKYRLKNENTDYRAYVTEQQFTAGLSVFF